MQRKRILFIGEGVTLAHIVRPLALAKALPSDEYEVFFACDPRYRRMIENEGLVWEEISSMTSDEFLKRLAAGEPIYTYARLKDYVLEELKLLERIKPDLIVSDFRVSLGVSAESLKIPYICLINVYWSAYSALIFPVPELPIVKVLGPKLVKVIFDTFSVLFLFFHMKGFNKLRKEYGLPPVTSLKNMYTHGTWTLYLDLPSLVPIYSLPKNHQYLGPVCDMPHVPQPEWWGQWPTDKPIIYLSFGSSGDISLLELFKRTLSQMKVTVLVTTSGRFKKEDFPTNFYVADYLSGLEVAKIAQVFVTNGGSGAIYQALTYGVPILGFPSNMDQFFLMERIERLGAGILVRPSKANQKIIVESIEALLSQPHFKEVAGGLGEHIRKLDTKERFKKFIAEVFIR